jgi:hypothetical protein
MAAHKETSWPSDGTLVTAYKENLMTAVTVAGRRWADQLVVAFQRVNHPSLTPSQLVAIAENLSTIPSTATAWTALQAAAQTHVDNPNPALFP